MPTPKEKAFELVVLFQDKVNGIRKELAKKQALKAVDVILNDLKESLEIAEDFHPHAKGILAGSLLAWQKVKIEIEKL
jgi:hypothetical protein